MIGVAKSASRTLTFSKLSQQNVRNVRTLSSIISLSESSCKSQHSWSAFAIAASAVAMGALGSASSFSMCEKPKNDPQDIKYGNSRVQVEEPSSKEDAAKSEPNVSRKNSIFATSGNETNQPTGMTPAEEAFEARTRKAKTHAGGLKLFSGNGNMALGLEIARQLDLNLGKATVGRFADGEVNVIIHENVRGKDCFIVQPTCPPVNDNIMELLLMVSTLSRASARRISVVIPYYGYARQDRKMQVRLIMNQ